MNLESMRDRRDLPALLNHMGCVGTGVEVGVYKGQFSYLILQTWPGTLIGVDSYNGGSDFSIMMNAIVRNNRSVHQGRYRLIVNKSTEAASHAPSDLDFAYIDADHSYAAVKEDIASWFPKVKRGGIFGGHDCVAGSGVHRAVTEFISTHPGLTLHTKPCGSWFVLKL
jgi:hypothetical protein